MPGRFPMDLDILDFCARRPGSKLFHQGFDRTPIAFRDHLDAAVGKIAAEAGETQSLRRLLRKRPIIDALHSTFDKNFDGYRRHIGFNGAILINNGDYGKGNHCSSAADGSVAKDLCGLDNQEILNRVIPSLSSSACFIRSSTDRLICSAI